LALVLALLAASGCRGEQTGTPQGIKGQADAKKGGASMTEDELIESLRNLDPDNRPAMDAFVKKVVRESRAPARIAVANLSASDPKVAAAAVALTVYLKDIAIVPLLEAPEPAAADDRVSRIETVVDAQVELREKITARLTKMLDDKAPVPINTDRRAEVAPPPRRVCDDAYVLLRRLLNPAEGEEEQLFTAKAFLLLPDDRKDAEILKARSGIWTRRAELR